MAVNKSDWSYGWHGHRAGLALYYFDETILLNEHHELRYENMKNLRQNLRQQNFMLSLTSDVTLHAQLMVTKTKLLGSPYTKCLPETQANKCYQEKTEEHIRNRLFVTNGINQRNAPNQIY